MTRQFEFLELTYYSALFDIIYFNEAFGLAQMYREQVHLLSQDGF